MCKKGDSQISRHELEDASLVYRYRKSRFIDFVLDFFSLKSEECKNCHAKLRPKDKYCRYCGTMRGNEKFDPKNNINYMATLYGPPTSSVYSQRTVILVVRIVGDDDIVFRKKLNTGYSVVIGRSKKIRNSSGDLIKGRKLGEDVDIVIDNDNAISENHLSISLTYDNLLLIRDLNSTNGTYVEGKRIEEAIVKPETEVNINIGRTIIVLHIEEYVEKIQNCAELLY